MSFLFVTGCSVFKFSQNIFTYTFTKNKFHVRFYYKVRQTLKQRANVITKLGSFFALLGRYNTFHGAINWSKWYYKVGQVL